MEQQNNSTAVAEIHENTDFMLGLNELKARANMVTEIKRQIMKNGTHFGVIPGCGDKPTLLKNGAELLCMAFKLAPEAKVEIADLGNGHREYTVTTTLVSIATGTPIATGLGSCSTMESKYRYRNVSDFELTGQPIPADAKERKQEYRRQGYGMKKVDGTWEWVRFKDSAKAENPDIADQYNTVLKMASKRSLVDATLKATGGSCEFTQDIEDMAPQGGYADYQDTGDDQPAPQQPRQNRTDPKAQLLAAVNPTPFATQSALVYRLCLRVREVSASHFFKQNSETARQYIRACRLTALEHFPHRAVDFAVIVHQFFRRLDA